ncbi:MAG: bifunctional D-glycero-beta-D-manno-heptose-7-phosphate kinase/D-glycero-beta-D-manno-heptose 1-phosphate adenylyltransferase HldE [Gammaproteobacteria bacterium]|nr:bifunctional D-glycero-beta-D-manno-heptose-7-phosphate kinase/D-glycero-beta-D-manno-heptose 1-phosphate adenylyltransferase HldE [Gammaproteobacteria bacterium]
MAFSIPSFADTNVLVAGDVMLDRYWFGPCSRISPEAPVPVVRVTSNQERAGGAANVAVNLASLGVKTRLLGITGDDDASYSLQSLLAHQGVEVEFMRMPDIPTTTKLRVISRNQQLLRMDFEEAPHPSHGSSLEQQISAALPEHGVIVLSDYAKGTLGNVQEVIAACRERDLVVLVDPKGSDFSRYAGATALTPNLSEFESVVGPCEDLQQLEEKGRALRQQLGLGFLLLTRSGEGMTLIPESGAAIHLPAETREVYDVTGAGDTVVAVLAAGLAAGQSPEDAARLSNLAAGLVVRKLGVASVGADELRMALHQRGKGGRDLVDRDSLETLVRDAQTRGERVVMTNGCFDILHAGHVAYLEEAKTLGDRLVVAVNDDDSVTRLKGAGRPINPLADRMSVLAGLAAVDWVAPFSEDTPEQLIEVVLPDVLVKGGDYQVNDVAGGKSVLANGGEVKILPFIDGRSTSGIIKSIRGE